MALNDGGGEDGDDVGGELADVGRHPEQHPDSTVQYSLIQSSTVYVYRTVHYSIVEYSCTVQ